MERVRRAVAVEIENPPPELYAVEIAYRRIVEEVAVGFDKIRQRQLELQKGHQLCSPSPAGAVSPRREERSLD
jgi:hypothetical protein